MDDMPEVRALFHALQRAFQASRVEFFTASSSREALDLLSSRPMEVVLSDYRMPGGNGLALLAEVRARAPNARRVLMSGYNEVPGSAEEFAAADVDAFVLKPVARAALLSLMDDLLSGDPARLAARRGEAREFERACIGGA